MSDFASITPSTIFFAETDKGVDRKSIRICNNRTDLPIAYKIRVSVQQVFVVPSGEGFIMPGQTVDVAVMMKQLNQFPGVDISRAKFAVEVCEVLISESGMDIGEFVKKHDGDFTRHAISCEVKCLPASGPFSTNATAQNGCHVERNELLQSASVNRGNISLANEPMQQLSASTKSRNSVSSTNNGIQGTFNAASGIVTAFSEAQIYKVQRPLGRVLDLMIKNVGKDSPLLPAEVEELKGIRSTLSKAEWAEWLSVAREEKRRRRDEASISSTYRAATTPNSHLNHSSFVNVQSVSSPHVSRRANGHKYSFNSPEPDNDESQRYINPQSDDKDDDDSLQKVYQEASMRAFAAIEFPQRRNHDVISKQQSIGQSTPQTAAGSSISTYSTNSVQRPRHVQQTEGRSSTMSPSLRLPSEMYFPAAQMEKNTECVEHVQHHGGVPSMYPNHPSQLVEHSRRTHSPPCVPPSAQLMSAQSTVNVQAIAQGLVVQPSLNVKAPSSSYATDTFCPPQSPHFTHRSQQFRESLRDEATKSPPLALPNDASTNPPSSRRHESAEDRNISSGNIMSFSQSNDKTDRRFALNSAPLSHSNVAAVSATGELSTSLSPLRSKSPLKISSLEGTDHISSHTARAVVAADDSISTHMIASRGITSPQSTPYNEDRKHERNYSANLTSSSAGGRKLQMNRRPFQGIMSNSTNTVLLPTTPSGQQLFVSHEKKISSPHPNPSRSMSAPKMRPSTTNDGEGMPPSSSSSDVNTSSPLKSSGSWSSSRPFSPAASKAYSHTPVANKASAAPSSNNTLLNSSGFFQLNLPSPQAGPISQSSQLESGLESGISVGGPGGQSSQSVSLVSNARASDRDRFNAPVAPPILPSETSSALPEYIERENIGANNKMSVAPTPEMYYDNTFRKALALPSSPTAASTARHVGQGQGGPGHLQAALSGDRSAQDISASCVLTLPNPSVQASASNISITELGGGSFSRPKARA